ncbi:MAG: 6-phosphofructokinase [Clostridiales bacterium]|nr:6-phosphofructokinase [Clostridiales bacterium]
MSNNGNAIVAQSGGPTAVINNSVCGVVETWLKSASGKIYGGISGIKGILAGDIIDLEQQEKSIIAGLRYTPGAGIFSCRHKVSQADQERLVDIFKKLDIRYFFYNGGNDSMDTAHKTYQAAQAAGWDLQVIGIPKTIDNDLPFTDHSPGYGSAAKYIAATVRETGIDLESVYTKNKVTVLEAMGRDAGWLTAAGALSKRWDDEAPHLIYLPETPFYTERFLGDVEQVYKKLGYCYVVVSEGIADEQGNYLSASETQDAFGHAQLSGAGMVLKNVVERELGIKARCNTLGTTQRAAAHFASRVDAEEAYMVGSAAVQYALSGKTGVMVTIERRGNDPYSSAAGEVALEKVANIERKFPMEWINEARNYVMPEFTRYALPLLSGEVSVPMKDGLPDYVRLDTSRGRVNLEE